MIRSFLACAFVFGCSAPAPTPTAPTPPPTGSDTGSGSGSETGSPSTAGLGDKCGENDACATGQTCAKYFGIAGANGPEFTSCEISCADKAPCPEGTKCITIADGPGQVCRP